MTPKNSEPRLIPGTTRSVAGIIVLAFLIVSVGQYTLIRFRQLKDPAIGLWLLGIGSAIGLLGLFLWPHISPPYLFPIKNNYSLSSRRLRLWLLIASLGLALFNALIVFSRQNDPTSTYWDTVSLWILSVALYAIAFLPQSQSRPRPGISSPWSRLGLLVILLLAFELRFHGLGTIPQVMEGDEADIGRQALAVVEGTQTQVFQSYRSYSTLQFFIMAPPISIFGPTKFALRLNAVFAGLLAVAALSVLARRLFGQTVGLLSAALLAVAHAGIHFSHVTIASTFDIALAIGTFYWLYRAIRTTSSVAWVYAGICMALSLFFYIGARAVSGVAIIFLVGLAIFHRSKLSGNRNGLAVLLGAFVITLAPLLPWILTASNSFNSRLTVMGIIQNGWLAQHLAQGESLGQVLLERAWPSLLIFNARPVGSFYDADVPLLGPLTGGLFLLGLILAFVHCRDVRFILLHSWLWPTLIAGQVLITTTEAYRTLTLLPAACLFAAIALAKLAEVTGAWGAKAWVNTGLVMLLLAVEAEWNIHYYFFDWAPSYVYGTSLSTRAASLIAEFAASLDNQQQIFVLSTKDFHASGWAVTDYLAKGRSIVDVGREWPALLSTSKVTFILPPQRQTELSVLQQQFPLGLSDRHYLGPVLYFTTYSIEVP